MVSVFDIFKIGIGPSSSHTVGPMKAGKEFVDLLAEKNLLSSVSRVIVDVYGSLSLTGKGHATDIAIIMGLAGNLPDTVDIDSIAPFIKQVETTGRLMLANGIKEVDFPVEGGMNFHKNNLPLHENGMTITAYNGEQVLLKKPIILLVAVLLLMKNILANLKKMQFKFLILINMRLIYVVIAKKQAFLYQH